MPVASLTVEQGRRLGRRQDRHLRPADRRQAVQRHVQRPPTLQLAAPAPGEAGRAVHDRRDARPPRDRHPGEGHGTYTYVAQRARPGHAARPARAAARPGRVRRRHEPRCRLGRRELDQAHPGRAGRARRQLPRRRRAEGVRRDPGRGAAEGEVGGQPPISGGGNLWKRMRDHDAAGKAPARTRRQHRATSTRALAVAPRKTYSQTLHVPLQVHAADRPDCAVADVSRTAARSSARTPRTATGTRPQITAALDAARQDVPLEQIRVMYYEGSSSYGGLARTVRLGEAAAILSQSRASRCASSSCAGTSTAGTTTARRSCRTSAAASTRTATSSRSTTRSFAWARSTRRPTAAAGRPADRRRPATARRHDDSRDAVQHPEPADHRQDAAAAEQLLQVDVPAGADRAADYFAYEQMIDELAYAAKHGPVRVPPEEHRRRRRRPAVLNHWHDALAASRRPRTGSRGWPPRTRRARNILTGRGIALGGFAGRGRRSSPRSR